MSIHSNHQHSLGQSYSQTESDTFPAHQSENETIIDHSTNHTNGVAKESNVSQDLLGERKEVCGGKSHTLHNVSTSGVARVPQIPGPMVGVATCYYKVNFDLSFEYLGFI